MWFRTWTDIDDCVSLFQVNSYEKEKGELVGRLHRTEGQVVNLRIENDMVRRDLADLEKEKTALQLEISTARIEFNYHQARL